jgi:hypothetical protein
MNDLNVILENAHNKWRAAEPLVAGRILFESIPTENVSEWSLTILKLAMKWIPPPSAVKRLARIDNRWRFFGATPRQHFDSIRKVTLRLESLDDQSQSQVCASNLCYLAENVAKTLANAMRRDRELEFDDDSGWWIVSCLYDCAKSVGNQQFFDECEQLLFGQINPS